MNTKDAAIPNRLFEPRLILLNWHETAFIFVSIFLYVLTILISSALHFVTSFCNFKEIYLCLCTYCKNNTETFSTIALNGLTDTIRDLGVTEVVEAMDMDQMTNENVRKAILAMRREVQKIPNIRYSKYTWNPAYKGVDDYFLSRAAAM